MRTFVSFYTERSQLSGPESSDLLPFLLPSTFTASNRAHCLHLEATLGRSSFDYRRLPIAAGLVDRLLARRLP